MTQGRKRQPNTAPHAVKIRTGHNANTVVGKAVLSDEGGSLKGPDRQGFARDAQPGREARDDIRSRRDLPYLKFVTTDTPDTTDA